MNGNVNHEDTKDTKGIHERDALCGLCAFVVNGD